MKYPIDYTLYLIVSEITTNFHVFNKVYSSFSTKTPPFFNLIAYNWFHRTVILLRWLIESEDKKEIHISIFFPLKIKSSRYSKPQAKHFLSLIKKDLSLWELILDIQNTEIDPTNLGWFIKLRKESILYYFWDEIFNKLKDDFSKFNLTRVRHNFSAHINNNEDNPIAKLSMELNRSFLPQIEWIILNLRLLTFCLSDWTMDLPSENIDSLSYLDELISNLQ